MTPVIIRQGSYVNIFTRSRFLKSTGRQLQIIYETDDYNGLDSHSFDWPWEVTIGMGFVDNDAEQVVIF